MTEQRIHPPSRVGRSLPRSAAAVVLVAIVTAACTGGGSVAAPSPAAPVSPAIPTALPSLTPVVPPSPGEGVVPPAVIDQAVADAADRAGVDPSAVTVVIAEVRTWPSGALGCPRPGFMYTDVITPGYQVVVEAGGRQYDYRASARGGDVVWCERPPVTS